jgi:hypothetical protein
VSSLKKKPVTAVPISVTGSIPIAAKRGKRGLKPCGVGDCVEIPIVLSESDLAVNDLVDRNNWVLRRLAVRRCVDHLVLVHDVDGLVSSSKSWLVQLARSLFSRPPLSRSTMLSGPRAASVGPNGTSRKMQSSLTCRRLSAAVAGPRRHRLRCRRQREDVARLVNSRG